MHNSFFGSHHLDHHAETNPDMSLSRKSHNLDSDLYRGTAFKWKTSFLIFVIALPQAYSLDFLFNGKIAHPWLDTCLVLALAIYQSIMWNSIHPKLHNVPNVVLKKGMPSILLGSNCFIRLLQENHIEHHRTKGRKNFNVTLLGADFLLGTHSSFSSFPISENSTNVN